MRDHELAIKRTTWPTALEPHNTGTSADARKASGLPASSVDAQLSLVVSGKTMSNTPGKISCSTFASGIAFAEVRPKNLHAGSLSHWRDELNKDSARTAQV